MHQQLQDDAHVFLTDLLGQEIACFWSRESIPYDEHAVCLQSFRPNGSVTTPVYLSIGAIPSFVDQITALSDPSTGEATDVWTAGDGPDSFITMHSRTERTAAQLSDSGRPSDGFRHCSVCGTLVNGDTFIELKHHYDRYDGNACIHLRCTNDLVSVLEDVYSQTDSLLGHAL